MTKIKTDIDSLFKQELGKSKAPVSAGSLSVFEKQLARKSFLFFTWNHFNIYYALVGTFVVGTLLYVNLFDADKSNKTILPKEIKKEQNAKSDSNGTQQQHIQTVVEENIPAQEIQTSSNGQGIICNKNGSCKIPTRTVVPQSDTIKKEIPVTALKAKTVLEKQETKTTFVTPKEIRQVDTLFANDTIKTVKRKLRVKWKK